MGMVHYKKQVCPGKPELTVDLDRYPVLPGGGPSAEPGLNYTRGEGLSVDQEQGPLGRRGGRRCNPFVAITSILYIPDTHCRSSLRASSLVVLVSVRLSWLVKVAYLPAWTGRTAG